jgi:hypothetical protein
VELQALSTPCVRPIAPPNRPVKRGGLSRLPSTKSAPKALFRGYEGKEGNFDQFLTVCAQYGVSMSWCVYYHIHLYHRLKCGKHEQSYIYLYFTLYTLCTLLVIEP